MWFFKDLWDDIDYAVKWFLFVLVNNILVAIVRPFFPDDTNRSAS